MSSTGNARRGSQSALEAIASQRPFVCPNCKKSYIKETALAKHLVKCQDEHTDKQRLYRRAYPLYEVWFRAEKRSTPTYDTFVESRFGSHFVKFIEWCDAMNVASPSTYARTMMANKLHPSVWTEVSSYKLYIRDFDEHVDLEDWIIATVNNIHRVCHQKRVETPQFYAATPPTELIHMLRTKMIYPRYLICDPAFNEYLTKLPTIIAGMISDAIPERYMAQTDPCDPMLVEVIRHVNG